MRGGKRKAPSSRLSFLPWSSHIYERMKKGKEIKFSGAMKPHEAVRATKLLEELKHRIWWKGVIHWNREMGMKKLKEMFPDVYKRELPELYTRPPEGRPEEALQL
jgi:hypothetical protein